MRFKFVSHSVIGVTIFTFWFYKFYKTQNINLCFKRSLYCRLYSLFLSVRSSVSAYVCLNINIIFCSNFCLFVSFFFCQLIRSYAQFVLVFLGTNYIWQTKESHKCKCRIRTDMRTNYTIERAVPNTQSLMGFIIKLH